MKFTIGDILRLTNTLLEESFKDDVINAYKKQGYDVGSDIKFLNAVKSFNTDNDIKSSIKKDLGNINGNIGQAVAKKYQNPQDFVSYISNLTSSLTKKREEQELHTKKKNNPPIRQKPMITISMLVEPLKPLNLVPLNILVISKGLVIKRLRRSMVWKFQNLHIISMLVR